MKINFDLALTNEKLLYIILTNDIIIIIIIIINNFDQWEGEPDLIMTDNKQFWPIRS